MIPHDMISYDVMYQRHLVQGTRDKGQATRDKGQARDQGQGTRDTWQETRDKRQETRDKGQGSPLGSTNRLVEGYCVWNLGSCIWNKVCACWFLFRCIFSLFTGKALEDCFVRRGRVISREEAFPRLYIEGLC